MFAIANVPRENRKIASMRCIMMSMACTRELTRESYSLFHIIKLVEFSGIPEVCL